MHMINIRRAFAAIGATLLALAFTPAHAADATTHPSPRVTVDLRRLPPGDCWYEVSWLNARHTQTNIEPLCAPTAPHATGDCALVRPATRTLCAAVLRQRAYGYTDDAGNPQNWTPDGPALIHDITHQHYTQPEIADALTAAQRDYRAHVTNVTFDVDKITKTCGHHLGNGVVQEIKGRDGHFYTWRRVVCD